MELIGVLKYRNDILKDIQSLVSIPSVLDEEKEEAPFGIQIKKALDFTLELGKKFGFKTRNFENYIGDITFEEKEEMLGILGHVDVVKAGEGWNFPAFSAVVDKNILYGRGVLDDKGPIIICLYAMKYLSELDKNYSRGVRLIIGTDEESQCRCIKYYLNTPEVKIPTLSFSPDGEFPVINIEKGLLKGHFEIKLEDKLIEINGSRIGNIVPDNISLNLDRNILNNFTQNEIKKLKEKEVILEENDSRVKIYVKGKATHSATPELGENAFLKLMEILKGKDTRDKNLNKVVKFFNRYIKDEVSGESLGVLVEDEKSGKLTINYANIFIENNILKINIDCRFPITANIEKIVDILKIKSKEFDVEFILRKITPPHHIPEADELVQKLLKVYGEVEEKEGIKPKYTGTSSYSRSFSRCVAFGPILENMENTIHQANERIKLEDLDKLILLYTKAIYELIK